MAELFRWLFLVVLAALNNLTMATPAGARPLVNMLLAVWSVANLGIMVLLARGYRPGRQFSLATMAMDIIFGAFLVYYSAGFSSPYFLALFLAIITSAVRFGTLASVGAALTIAFLYLFVGGEATPSDFQSTASLSAIGKVFLFLVVALATGFMTRELERERRVAISRAAQADALREMSVSMASSLDIKDVFQVIVDQALRMTAAQQGDLVLAFEDGFQKAATASLAPPPAEKKEEKEEKADKKDDKGDSKEADVLAEDLLGQVARSGEAAFVANRTGMVVPVASGDGVTALLSLTSDGKAFSNEDLFMINALAGSAAVPLANALHYQRSTQEATTDGLTGLLNHREFRRRLGAAFSRPNRRGQPVSVMLIDFDHFKQVNDTVGHQHGDLVLRSGARVVRSTVRTHDLVARYGGDELSVVLLDAGPDGAAVLADRVVANVHAAKIGTVPDHQLTFSIGVASYPEDAHSAEELVMAADQALYLAKRQGKDRARTFASLVRRLQSADETLVDTLVEFGPQVALAVAHVIDLRENRWHGHSSRVAAVAEAVGRRAGYPVAELEALRHAALLHDVGHLALARPLGDEEPPEHAEMGEQVVARAPFPAEVRKGIRHHHERWDGGGFPDRLAGEAIPVEARIVALADAYEERTAGRSGQVRSPLEAIDSLASEAGHAFDPKLVEALRALVQEGDPAVAVAEVAVPAPA